MSHSQHTVGLNPREPAMVTLEPHCLMGSLSERRAGVGVKGEDGEEGGQEVREAKTCWEESQGCIPREP